MTKEASELNLPEDLRYAKDHEWARADGDAVTVGLDDYAQDQLGDIVFVEMPEVGDKIDKGTVFATVDPKLEDKNALRAQVTGDKGSECDHDVAAVRLGRGPSGSGD